MIRQCQRCHKDFYTEGRSSNRAKYCPTCRYDVLIEQQQRYYQNNREKILAKSKARYRKLKEAST
ncbi:MAG: hypothetical protein IKN27_08875 [Selenomonadaceae bacterium]|nr:hypothetical protein [Selenomonadaceae bacterium]